ncbi:MAG: aminotransferase class IV [Propionibacteriaceae bacterium]
MPTSTLSSSTATTSPHLRVWLNDRLVDPAEARVSALDHGLVVGDGVFEAFKVGPAGAFSVRRHLDRMTRSARAMGLPDPDHAVIREAVEATIAGRAYEHGKIRITYTGGAGPLGSQPASGPPTLVVAADSRTLSEPEATILTTPWTRNERGAMTGVKTTSYGENVRGLAYAYDRQATEAIFLNTAGNVCEGTGSNLFVVSGGVVHTPPLNSGPLAGITRELLIEWSDVVESDLTLDQAQAADEVFLTSSLRDVQPVTRWDDQTYAVGPVTRQLAEMFARRCAADLEP